MLRSCAFSRIELVCEVSWDRALSRQPQRILVGDCLEGFGLAPAVPGRGDVPTGGAAEDSTRSREP